MGPRPDGRGRRGAGPPLATIEMRQWGRGRMAAEGGVKFDDLFCLAVLRQWGRGRMAAEGARGAPMGSFGP